MVLALSPVLLCAACAAERPAYAPQIDQLARELEVENPASAEDACRFAMLRSFRLNFGLDGLTEELSRRMEDEERPWTDRVLFGYLLALTGEPAAFRTILDRLGDRAADPAEREGLVFCVWKFLGFTELDLPSPVAGWESDPDSWENWSDRIEEVGLPAWRREYLSGIILSGRPDNGVEAEAAADWLSYVLKPSDVPFLSGLFGRGSPRCDGAVLRIIEHVLMRRFKTEEGKESLENGMQAFYAWYAEKAAERPDAWITASFRDAGFDVEDVYTQKTFMRLLPGLFDDSENWVLVRSHVMQALNRISGFRADRALIFQSEEDRHALEQAYQAWYEDLAGRLLRE